MSKTHSTNFTSHINLSHIMRTPKHQRSPMEQSFRDRAAQSLREFRSIKRDDFNGFDRGLARGLSFGFKFAAEEIALRGKMETPESQRPDYGRPVFLKQPVPAQSIEEMEAEARVHTTPSRVNPHE